MQKCSLSIYLHVEKVSNLDETLVDVYINAIIREIIYYS